jgi:hypothetical protein
MRAHLRHRVASRTRTTLALRCAVLANALLLFAACSGGEAADAPAASTTAETPDATAQPAPPTTYTLATGTLVDAELLGTISSRDAVAGDVFSARVVRDVTNAAARVAIPAGSLVEGTIIEVSPAQNTRSTGTLTLAIANVAVRGTTYPLEASIDSLETLHEGRGIEAVDAARVAGGAAAGAILGRVIGGDTKGAIIGGVAGGAAGAVVSVIMRDVDIVLPAGSHMMLTLRQPLSVAVR